jgi:glyoxylase-like metal-dependent hydrolase (beta-lactamase superfamily II)
LTEIIPNVYHLKIPIPNNPLGHTNIYVLRSSQGYIMIDTGMSANGTMDAMRAQLVKNNIPIEKISLIIITHAHGDHIGLAGPIQKESGAKIALHTIEVNRLTAAIQNPILRWTDEWHREAGIPVTPPPINPGSMRLFPEPPPPDIPLENDQHILQDGVDLQVIWTPGHSPGHICLYDVKNRVLFSGDHILPVTTPNIGIRPGTSGPGFDNPLWDYINALDRVRHLEVAIVLPGHEQIFTNLQGRISEILTHHHHRNEEIIATLENEPKTAFQISERITWMPETGGVKFQDLSYFNQRMAVSETLAHLQALRTGGKIKRFGNDGVVYYQLLTGVEPPSNS